MKFINRTLQGDCMKIMRDLPDGCADMILCDLPYGTSGCAWDTVLPLDTLWEMYRRLLKPRAAVLLTASQPFTTTLIQSNQEWFKYCWVWLKSKPGDVFNAKNKPLKAHEDVCVFSEGTTANRSKRQMPYFPDGLRSTNVRTANSEKVRAFAGPRPSHGATYRQLVTGYPTSVLRFSSVVKASHPTQKPVALFEYLIRMYTQPGAVVLDNCCGSGTTGVAAIGSGRRFIQIEQDAGYVKIARRRSEEAASRKALECHPPGSLI